MTTRQHLPLYRPRRLPRPSAGAATALTAAAAVAAAAVLALASPSEAQGREASGGSAEQALQAFRRAAAQRDPAALADLTAWPFLFEGRPLGREAFIRQAVPALFTPAVRRCLQSAPARREDGRLVLWCQPYGFYLGPADGAWRLVEFATDTP